MNITTDQRISFREKVDFLRDKNNYPGDVTHVKVEETHMSVVFLTDTRVYKLKKPVQLNPPDFRDMKARHHFCLEEVRINRTLAENTYLDVVPLVLNEEEELELNGWGNAIDWLVLMVRLPADKMLDLAIKKQRVDTGRLRDVANKLMRFYKSSRAVIRTPGAHIARLKEELIQDRDALLKAEYGLDEEKVRRIAEWGLAFTARARAQLEERVRNGWIIEGHGDLKPDHIALTDPPVIIDRLEFNRIFRTLDPLADIALLAMESERLGNDTIGTVFCRTYQTVTRDAGHDELFRFYTIKAALLRAKLTIRHILEDEYKNDPKWRERTEWYLAKGEALSALSYP